jgi:hypothetical protein
METEQINGIANAILELVKALPNAIRADIAMHLQGAIAKNPAAAASMDNDLERSATEQKLALMQAMVEAACS